MKSPNLICHYNGMLCIKRTLLLFFLCIINFGYTQTYPQQVTVNSVDWGSYQFPSSVPPYQNSFTDPVTGNTVTRISDEVVFGCDCSKLRHRYAKNQAWNADGTLIMSSGSPSRILDGETFQVLYESYTKALWSNTEPNYTYDAAGNATFVKKNIITNQTTVLRQFSGYNSISVGNNEGNLSNDDRYVALIGSSGSNNTIIVYDILNDQIVSTMSIGTYDIDWVSVSQTGEYVVVSGYADGSGYMRGIKVFDKFMNNEIHLYNGRPHGDIGFDAQGNEVYVAYQGLPGYALSYARLDNGQKQGLFPYSGVTGDRGLWGGHISTRNLDRPGWAYVSEQGHPSDINRYEATREIFAIKLDDSNTIERFAKHNSNINISSGYNHQAHAVPNRDGTKVLFASNWDISSLKNNNYPVMFVVQAPQDSNGSQVDVAANTETICEGSDVTLTATGADSYAWDYNNETSSSFTVSLTETTTFVVTGTHSDGSTTQASITITVNETPTANAGNDVSTCLGTSVTLTASGGSSYEWNTGQTTQSITVNPNETTTYSVIATENGCESLPDTVTVTVNEIPTVDAGLDETIFLGESVTLTASGADSYLWSTGETTQSITVNPIQDTSYSVTGTTNDCEATDTVTVFLQDDSVDANAGVDTEICNGETVTLTATGGATYTWNTGETTASIEVSPTETTTYTVTVFSESGNNSEDDSVIVTVNDIPVANAGDDVDVCFGNMTTLTASGGTSYVWSTGATTQSINVNPNETTTYTVEVFENNCSSTDEVTVTVNEIPDVSAGTNVVIAPGESTTLTATGADTYIWETGETTASIEVSPDVTTIFTVTGFSNGCEASANVTVTVQSETVIANAGDDVTICEGNTTTLTASGGSTYVWNTGETTASIEVSPNDTTTYTVTAYSESGNQSDEDSVTVTVNTVPVADAGNDQNICFGNTATLNASGGGTYLWSTGATTSTISVNPTTTTTYTVEVFENGCSSTDEVTVTVNEIPDVSAGTNVVIASGESTTLTATGADTYLWETGETTASIEVSPNVTTIYTVTGFLNGCEDSANVTVTVQSETVIANAGEDVTICEGNSTTLTASGGVTYLWNTGETTASIEVSPNNTTTYTVTAFNTSQTTSDEASVTVTVNPLPTTNAGADVTITEGESTTLTVTGAESYLWSTGETTSNISVAPEETTTYTVTGFSNECEFTDEVTVTVEPFEFIASAGSDQTICQGYETTLTASEGDSYLWSTGETTQSITVNPANTQTYSVTVFQNGYQDDAEVMVAVNPNPNVVIANGGEVMILEGEFVTLSASGANSYLWNNGATQPNIAVSPSVTTTYEVTGYINNCEDTKAVVVNVFETVEADAGEDMWICSDETVILTATGGDEYLWSTGETTQSIEVSPNADTEYSVLVYNALDSDEATVTVYVDQCNVIQNPPESEDFDFVVFQEPTSDLLKVKINGLQNVTAKGISIFDMSGKILYTELFSPSELQNQSQMVREINTSPYARGIYMVRLIYDDTSVIKKIPIR